MIRHLEIQGFRGFNQFEIHDLGHVNLIVGKNNIGKTSLLEAVHLLVSGPTPFGILRIFRNRTGERALRSDDPSLLTELASSLFHGRPNIIKDNPFISMHGYGDILHDFSLNVGFTGKQVDEDSLDLRFKNGAELTDDLDIRNIRLFVKSEGEQFMLPLQPSGIRWSSSYTLRNPRGRSGVFVSKYGLEARDLENYWDSVALTEAEDDIIEALKLIEPSAERLAMLGSTSSRGFREPVIRVKSFGKPVPLRDMGDGMMTIFQAILSLCAAKNGYLFIDEIENGLHYSVLPRFWEFLMRMAMNLNVQIFATTHSLDCVKSFSVSAVNSDAIGKLFRLEHSGEFVRCVEFDEDELESAEHYGLEVR